MNRNRYLWTLDDLCARVAVALSDDYAGQANGQVRDVPDRRTIRYYTTLGLLDRPLEMRGRTALYGLRHLRQIVAIKRMQAQGLSLSAIQEKLLGLSEANLARLGRIPEDALEMPTPAEEPPESFPSSREAFWTEIPSPPSVPCAGDGIAPITEGKEPKTIEGPEGYVTLQGIPLDLEVTVLLPTVRSVTPEDVEAIRAAAAPLLKLLQKRRLLRPRQERTPL